MLQERSGVGNSDIECIWFQCCDPIQLSIVCKDGSSLSQYPACWSIDLKALTIRESVTAARS